MAHGTINAPSSWITLPDGSTYLNVNALLDSEALKVLLSATPKITVISVTNSGTKTSHPFQDGVKQIIVRCEKVTEIKYNFDETDFDGGIKSTITSGGFLKLAGLNFTGKSLFFETDRNNVDVEILELY